MQDLSESNVVSHAEEDDDVVNPESDGKDSTSGRLPRRPTKKILDVDTSDLPSAIQWCASKNAFAVKKTLVETTGSLPKIFTARAGRCSSPSRASDEVALQRDRAVRFYETGAEEPLELLVKDEADPA